MHQERELDTIGNIQKSPYHSETEAQSKYGQDARVLARLGKKSVLEVTQCARLRLRQLSTDEEQRRFGFISILGFTCTILITWEGSLM